MKNSMNSSGQQPMIVKYMEPLHNGIQTQVLSCPEIALQRKKELNKKRVKLW